MLVLLPVLSTGAFAAEAPAVPALIVWAQPEVPDDETRKKAERLTGPATHLAWADVALEVAAFATDDEARLTSLKQSIAYARAKWELFDVELSVAKDLDGGIDSIGVLRDDADRKLVVEALLLEASASIRSVPEARFASADELSAMRRVLAGRAVSQPLVDVLALEPAKVWTRADVPDGVTLQRMVALQEELRALPRGTLELGSLPKGAQVVIDGRPLAGSPKEVGIEPGHHYVHVIANGRITVRKEIDVESNGHLSVEPTVTLGEVEDARKALVAGTREVGEDFARAAEAAARRTQPPSRLFCASIDDEGATQIAPWAHGAVIDKRKIVTVVLAGGVGGGVLNTPGFAKKGGAPATAGAFGGDLGIEIGITYAVIYGGGSLLLTPSEAQKYKNQAETANESSPAYFRPYGGIGLYLPRPRRDQPLLMLGGNYGWLSPGALGPGVKLSFGVPLEGDGTWLRFDLDGFRGEQMDGFPGETEAVWLGALRIGFGRLL